LVKNEQGDPLDAKTGAGIISYDETKDFILVDRAVKLGNFDLFIQGVINENMTVMHPLSVSLEEYWNPAPQYAEPQEPIHLLAEVYEET
jgi:hypothetical protein